MTSEDPRRDQTAWQSETLPHPALQPEFDGRLRRAVGEVMDIEDITLPLDSAPLRFRGRLTLPSDQAFDRLRPAFEEVGYTPQLRRDEGRDVVSAIPGVFHGRKQGIPWVNVALLVATILSVFYVEIGRAHV